MNCKEIRELLPDLAAGMDATTPPEVEKHIASCKDCARELGELQKTMALLEEWQASRLRILILACRRACARKWRVRRLGGFIGCGGRLGLFRWLQCFLPVR